MIKLNRFLWYRYTLTIIKTCLPYFGVRNRNEWASEMVSKPRKASCKIEWKIMIFFHGSIALNVNIRLFKCSYKDGSTEALEYDTACVMLPYLDERVLSLLLRFIVLLIIMPSRQPFAITTIHTKYLLNKRKYWRWVNVVNIVNSLLSIVV